MKNNECLYNRVKGKLRTHDYPVDVKQGKCDDYCEHVDSRKEVVHIVLDYEFFISHFL